MAVEPSSQSGSLDTPPLLPRHIRVPVARELEIDVTERADSFESSKVATSSSQSIVEMPVAKKNSLPKEKVYGAPRVFDLFTLLAITLAFAVLFALLGLLAPALDFSARGLTIGISSYIALVGLAQMWFFGANNPRAASLVGGPIAMIIVCFFPIAFSESINSALVFSIGFGVTIGPITGYLAGAVVAGVFLVADKIRAARKTSGSVARDATFDEIL